MKFYTWPEAKRAIRNLNRRKSGKHHDWRLPTIEELESILDRSRVNPACKLRDMQPASYWSATPAAHNPDLAWLVYFSCGGVYCHSKSNVKYVRAVRSGENGLEWSETL